MKKLIIAVLLLVGVSNFAQEVNAPKNKKDKGSKIMQNFKKQVVANNNLKEILSESKKSSIFINGFDVKTQKKGNSK